MDATDLKDIFAENNFSFDDESVTHQCLLFMQDYQLTSMELAELYELFAIEKKLGREVTVHGLSRFDSFLKKKIRRVSIATTSTQAMTYDVEDTTPTKVITSMEALSMFSEQREITNASYLTSGKSFTARKKKGERFLSLNEHLDPSDSIKTNQAPGTLEVLSPAFPRKLQIAKDTIKRKIDYIDKRIQRFAEALKEYYSIHAAAPVRSACQESVWICGMVCCDCDGRLNETSIKLLGSRSSGSSQSIQMDVSEIPSYSLFPGQCIGVKASNPTGDRLHVKEIIDQLPQSIDRSIPFDLMETDSSIPSFSVFIAAGPFTSDEDLAFEGLREIEVILNARYFDLVMLIGPFMDDRHPIIQSGQVVETFNQIYEQQVESVLLQFEQLCGRLVIIPSIRDVHHPPIFPQPPFHQGRLQNASMLSNPTAFVFNGVVFGVCSQDVIKNLSMSTCERDLEDRIGSLFKHVIGQRSFLPIFPSPLGTCLDTGHAVQLEIPMRLDVIITPSDLIGYAKFLQVGKKSPSSIAKETDKTIDPSIHKPVLCLNPGFCMKGQRGGTYAVLNVLSDASSLKMDISNICRVDIKYI